MNHLRQRIIDFQFSKSSKGTKPNSNLGLLSLYTTAGYPQLGDLPQVLRACALAGVDFVEVGAPFNDPIADGEVIQQASQKALKNGMTIERLFNQVEAFQASQSKPLALVWMGYLNFLLQRGVERFLTQAKKVGFSGLIVPDWPLEHFLKFQDLFKQMDMMPIFLISPQTPVARVRKIDALSYEFGSFLYLVSSQSTTGQAKGIDTAFIQSIDKLELKSPKIVGFNIKNHTDYIQACQWADGVIIGSAFLKHLGSNQSKPPKILDDTVAQFVQSIRVG